uniref:Uncharacterized protein n=1 Tax=Oreochromis niloticus TaxID=8128 RepID=A0A669E7Y5_ORENI
MAKHTMEHHQSWLGIPRAQTSTSLKQCGIILTGSETKILIFQFFGFSNVEIGVTSDGKTIVCYHPTADIPYELTQVRQYCVAFFKSILDIVLDLLLFYNK